MWKSSRHSIPSTVYVLSHTVNVHNVKCLRASLFLIATCDAENRVLAADRMRNLSTFFHFFNFDVLRILSALNSVSYCITPRETYILAIRRFIS